MNVVSALLGKTIMFAFFLQMLSEIFQYGLVMTFPKLYTFVYNLKILVGLPRK